MRFSREFWQNKQGNANSNSHTKLQAYILANIFIKDKIRIMEFLQPSSTNDFDDSPTHTTPQKG